MKQLLLALCAFFTTVVAQSAIIVEVVTYEALENAFLCGESRVMVGDSFYPGESYGELSLSTQTGQFPPSQNNYQFMNVVSTPVKLSWDNQLITKTVGPIGSQVTLSMPAMPFTELYLSAHSLNLLNDGSLRVDNIRLNGQPIIGFFTVTGVAERYYRISGFNPNQSGQLEFNVTFNKGTGQLFQYPFIEGLEARVAMAGVPEPSSTMLLVCGVIATLSRRYRSKASHPSG